MELVIIPAARPIEKIDLFYTANFIKNTQLKNHSVHNFKKLITLDHQLTYRPIYLKRKKKILPIFVGVKDYPSFISGNSIALIGEFNDIFFQYSIDSKQRVALLNTRSFTNDKVMFAKKVVDCPEEFKKIEIPKYFSARFCKYLLNIKTGKLETILDFKACP